ncbi:4-oxalomesaconate tautomerase [Salinibacterium sp. SYSU T00001]|uniref:4-oxalomesaconate tautomerase n=1 Tax=Homoserinimonas sedimenticola TaxID=2986805 RepID=UPI00223593E7|nr:4-oxalomesaconate tautomerase [Salinibacterium sedimenticola]MCW4386040.1 4-oxalomesaconate tautomerase [Salinibacterium sedimenticola]
MSDGVRCMLMRGGTSKGAYFLESDLPSDAAERDDVLLRIMGSPDERQIDGIGGAHPLTSKVAVVAPSTHPDCDVDYLFLQVVVDQAIVSDAQTCGNLLAGVAPFAIERGLVAAEEESTRVRIRILNGGGGEAVATVETPGRQVSYEGDVMVSGVPFGAAPIELEFPSEGGALFPTGRLTDVFADTAVSCVDAGMPVVLIRAADLGLEGDESPEELEADGALRERLERIRLEAGRAMGFGDVTDTTVPKLSIVSPPRHGGTITTRTFIPHRVHTSIGVLGAVSVAVGVAVPETVASFAVGTEEDAALRIEHPTGYFDVELELDESGRTLRRSAVIRTARKLFDGVVWPRPAAAVKGTTP